MAESRDERRRKAKEDGRRRQEEIDRILEQPRPAPFEAPASGTIVESGEPGEPGGRPQGTVGACGPPASGASVTDATGP
jgi:hypothetical protein